MNDHTSKWKQANDGALMDISPVLKEHLEDTQFIPPPRPLDFHQVAHQIESLRHQTIVLTSLSPAEVWLGPQEVAAFNRYVDREMAAGRGRQDDRFKGVLPMWMGLTIRESMKPGVRVGATFGAEGVGA